MSGLTSDPSADDHEPTPDSAPWIDTEEAPLHPEPALAHSASAAPSGTDQLPTIGHIGRYALKYQIGEGGLGRVYAAHDPLLSRLIAIKTLNLEIAAEERESFNALFLNEARAAGGLSHPHIVTVFDAGVSEQGAYIAMELLKGRDLRQLRLEGWKPTPTQAALIVRRVSDALAYAHSKGVVHRDIKPANIFMVGRTQPRVLDFGIARVAHHHDDGDIAGGSPYYMSPEQVRHQPVDRRCDVFSLGVVLYELLTGTRPFRGASLKEITDAVVEYQPPRAHEVDVGVPKALSDIAYRAMEKNAEDRYRSARALSRELRHWLEEHAQENENVEEIPAPAKGRKKGWALAAVTVAALVIAGAWWTFAPHGEGQVVAKAAPAASAVEASASQPASAAVATAASAQTVAEAASAAASVALAAPAIQVATASAPTPSTSPASAAAPLPIIPSAATASGPTPPVAAAPVVVAPVVAAPVTPSNPPTLVVQATKPAASKETTKETGKERRAREAREREAKLAAGTAAPAAQGVVHLAVTPWGQVEVDGKPAGTAPPLSEISLSEGRHTITIRNDEFPPFSSVVTVVPGQPVTLKHRFGT